MKFKYICILFLTFFSLDLFSQADTTISTRIPSLSNWNWSIFVLCLLGVLFQELLYRRELITNNSTGKKNVKLFSGSYWPISIGVFLLSTLLAFFYFTIQEPNANFFTIITYSAAFPRIFKATVAGLQSFGQSNEGGTTDENTTPEVAPSTAVRNTNRTIPSNREFTWRDYLMVR